MFFSPFNLEHYNSDEITALYFEESALQAASRIITPRPLMTADAACLAILWIHSFIQV